MSNINEEQLKNWSKPPSETEEEKATRAEKAVKQALENSSHSLLDSSNIRVFAKGSYPNNTNIRLDSDVDIAVEYRPMQRFDKEFDAKELSDEDLAIYRSKESFDHQEYTDVIEQALRSEFGSSAVRRSSSGKAIRVDANSSRLPLDVVPCQSYRRYESKHINHDGIVLKTNSSIEVINWPEQNKTNGTKKNNNTYRRYKSLVRIIKRLKNDMVENGALQEEISSYFLECLVYNVPDESFGTQYGFTYNSGLRVVLAYIFNETLPNKEGWKEFAEVNELQYLLRSSKWTKEDAHDFADAAWNYMGYK